MTDRPADARRYTRRGVLGASAALGMLAAGGPAALAGTTGATGQISRSAARAATVRQGDAVVAADVAADADAGAGVRRGGDTGDVWGVSASGEGTGVRGNGHRGVVGEGTHTGVTGEGFIGVRGTTSIIEDNQKGVGVLAQAQTPGSIALQADGPARFNGQADFSGVTTFSRSGVVTVRSGSKKVTTTGVALRVDTVILATLQRRVGDVRLHAVETDPVAGSFTIFLTAAPAVDLPVGWFAVG